MKTWLNREGVCVSEKPKEYFVGKDAHGNNVFIGDVMKSKDFFKGEFKVIEDDYFSTPYYISKCILKIKH
jgi:hypothetical protein